MVNQHRFFVRSGADVVVVLKEQRFTSLSGESLNAEARHILLTLQQFIAVKISGQRSKAAHVRVIYQSILPPDSSPKIIVTSAQEQPC